MKLVTTGYPLPVSMKLIQMLEREISKSNVTHTEPIYINLRDPAYTAETGGFHPVEIAVANNRVQYVTDLMYYGSGHWAELGKDLDFDFSLGLFQQQGVDHPIERGRSMFRLWTENFCDYYAMGIYQISITNG
jgi:hypothetical protein